MYNYKNTRLNYPGKIPAKTGRNRKKPEPSDSELKNTCLAMADK